MEPTFRTIMGVGISTLSAAIVVGLIMPRLTPKINKEVAESEQKAKAERSVAAGKKMYTFFLIMLILLNAVGILLVAWPTFFIEYLEFGRNGYIGTLIFWFVLIVFDDMVFCFMSTKATYDDEKIVVKKMFSRPKEYYFRDIVGFTRFGNLKVETTSGKFTLLNLFIGTDSLRKFLMQKSESRTAETVKDEIRGRQRL